MWLNCGGRGDGGLIIRCIFCLQVDGLGHNWGMGLIRGSLWCTCTFIMFASFVISFLFCLSNVIKRKPE